MTDRVLRLTITTPEGITFSLPLAGPVVRALAWTVDLLAILALGMIARQLLFVLLTVSLDLFRSLAILSSFVITLGYGILFEWRWRGQTPGKRLLGLRVIDASGLKLRPSQIVVRNLLRAVDGLPAFFLVGAAAAFLTKRAQRLGDLAAGTVVVRVPRIDEPDLSGLLTGKFNSLAERPHLAARLRQRVTPEEAAAAREALVRREGLDPARRVALFQELSLHFRSVVAFPQEATDGITDEQYVRNVVEILYRKSGADALLSTP